VLVSEFYLSELKDDLNLELPYNPETIEQERYFESKPKQESNEQDEATGMNFLLDMLKKVDDKPEGSPDTQADIGDEGNQKSKNEDNQGTTMNKRTLRSLSQLKA
jgi:hypothetical protein